MKTAVILLFFVMAYSGCAYDFEMPTVVSATPGYNEMSVSSDANVTVRFSAAMDTMKTCNEFSLNSQAGRVNGYYSWQEGNRELVFRPAEPLARAQKYTIRITDQAEDAHGNDLRDEFVSVFYTGGDDVKPAVERFLPAANSTGNAENSSVRIFFTEAMDPATVYDGISISPAVEGYYSWAGGNIEAVFTPVKGFRYGVTYKVTVNTNMRDAAGNTLANDESFSFTVGDDFTPPGLSVYQDITPRLNFDENLQNTGAEKNGSIVIDFTERVATDRISSAVGISPAAEFYMSTETVNSGGIMFTRAVMRFTKNLKSEETYTLKIGSAIADLQENNLARDYRYVFVTNGAGSIAPKVNAAGDLSGGIISSPWAAGSIPVLTIGSTGNSYLNIGIEFSQAADPLTLHISVDLLTSPGNTASIVNIDWPDTAPGGKFTVLSFGLYNVSQFATYRITVKGGENGLRDSGGNCMKEDFVQIVKFR